MSFLMRAGLTNGLRPVAGYCMMLLSHNDTIVNLRPVPARLARC
jgi:hypothetical protein